MNQDNIQLFIKEFKSFCSSDLYQKRKNQKAIVPVFKEIIKETLKHEKLTNQHLTDLIQIFKHNCSNDNFDNKIIALVKDKNIRENLSDQAYEIGEVGYTNAGKTGVSGLTSKELSTIKFFLTDAFNVSTIPEAIELCKSFNDKKIAQVKKGIYSPWLHYINPEIFPIVNNSHKNFKAWLDLSDDYSTSIEEYNTLNGLVRESELGPIDYFAHILTKDGKLNFRRVHYLNTSRLYKMSHGIFLKRTDFIKSGIIKILEENDWICLGKYTGKGGGDDFKKKISIGDLIYLCYGGDKMKYVAKVTSDAKPLKKEHASLLKDDDEEWIYREVEPLYYPIDSNISDLKTFRSQIMPSGNSTFWEIKPHDFKYLNDNLLIPKFNLEILKTKEFEDDETEEVEINDNEKTLKNMPLNTILYGPPGTGKTFHSISHAIAIIENESVETIMARERESVKSKFDQCVIDGQIVFSTFHQSLSYEDFIEGIKPNVVASDDEGLTYEVKDGIFKTLCTEASFSFVQQNKTSEIEEVLDFSTEYDRFVDSINERFSKEPIVKLEAKNGGSVVVDSISQNNNFWITHIHGSRRYTVSKNRLSKISKAFPDLNTVTNINNQFKAEMGGSNSSAYWAVLNAIRKQPAITSTEEKKLSSEKEYSYEDKKQVIESLKQDDYAIGNPKKFVLIIDEINRGNVSQIFGELITLIEDDKRAGKEESLKAILPYSKDNFGVPPNLYIIGTMNTADRSVEALDTALRRRFSFVPKMPDESKLDITEEGIDLRILLQTINNRLKVLKDNDHTIGHAWLWSVSNIEQLKNTFENKILPLLQEYFYNDYEKLGLVLGDAFFELPHKRVDGNEFASFTGSNGLPGQYRNKYIYKLKNAQDLEVADFLTLTQIAILNED